jgi:hypothetical protein
MSELALGLGPARVSELAPAWERAPVSELAPAWERAPVSELALASERVPVSELVPVNRPQAAPVASAVPELRRDRELAEGQELVALVASDKGPAPQRFRRWVPARPSARESVTGFPAWAINCRGWVAATAGVNSRAIGKTLSPIVGKTCKAGWRIDRISETIGRTTGRIS